MNKELEVLKFIDKHTHKTLDGLQSVHIIPYNDHLIQSLQGNTSVSELVDIIVNLVTKGDLVQVTREEDMFGNGKIYKNHYFTIAKQGKLRIKPFYIRIPQNIWRYVKNDGYVFLSIISTILSIISIVRTSSTKISSTAPLHKGVSNVSINQQTKFLEKLEKSSVSTLSGKLRVNMQ